jgi:death-on-curing family protein
MKNSHRLTVAKLAELAGLQLDETLLCLWDAGFDEVTGPKDELSGSRLELAKRAVALPTKKQLTSPAYWQRLLSVDEREFHALLRSLQVPMTERARKLPKGAIKKLTSETLRQKSKPIQPVAETPRVVSITTVPAPEWRTVGHQRKVRLLSCEEVLAIHYALVADFSHHDDPIDPPGPRNADIIASAVFRQHTSIGRKAKYPSVEMSAAALLHSLVHDHPFHNGNKRTALVSMLALLDENDLMLTCHEDDLFKFILTLAQHRLVEASPTQLADREVLATAEWIKPNCRPIERGDRPLPFRRLRQILTRYGCSLDHSTSGSNMKITRTIAAKGLFARSRTLTTNVSYGGEGREVLLTTINKIRADLELDEEHGIDSAAFYIDLPAAATEFIVKYRKTLDRLAKL